MLMPPSKKSPRSKLPNFQCDGKTHQWIIDDVERANKGKTLEQTRFKTEQPTSLTIKPKPKKGRGSTRGPLNAFKDPKGKKGTRYEAYFKANNKMRTPAVGDRKQSLKGKKLLLVPIPQ
jgi:hypothetical protein